MNSQHICIISRSLPVADNWIDEDDEDVVIYQYYIDITSSYLLQNISYTFYRFEYSNLVHAGSSIITHCNILFHLKIFHHSP